MKKLGACFLALLLLINVLIPSVSAEKLEPKIKVKLVNYFGNKTEVTIKPTGEYLIDQSIVRLTTGKSYLVKYNKNKITILDGTTPLFTSDTVKLLPLKETNYLAINNRNYLGSFQFVPENSKYVRPINEIFMEDYLKGVVPSEMYAEWHREALKTQAVAARTYAFSYQGVTIDDTINYQVYGGYNWHPNSTAAVYETKGEVIKVNGRLISAVFSASNGGKTESNANSWNTSPVSYLTIKEDKYDAKTAWDFSVKKQQFIPAKLSWSQMKENDTTITNTIKAWMANHGYAEKEIKITAIPVLSLHTPTSGGRVSKGDITVEFFTKDKVDEKGSFIPQKKEYKNVAASQIRAMVGNRIMKSYLVTNKTETDETITVKGLGDGHGVGLSQWGAQNRAMIGNQKYDEILGFYYEGAAIVKEYSERPLTVVQAPGNTNEPKKDKTAPKISSVKVSVDNKKNKGAISFKVNETAKVTVYIKNNSGRTLSYLKKDVSTKAGTTKLGYSTASLGNGRYSVVISAADSNKNRSSVTTTFNVKKVVKTKTGKVTASRLNVRATASTKSKVIGTLKKNQSVTIVSTNGTWKKIKYGKTTGYVSSKYIK